MQDGMRKRERVIRWAVFFVLWIAAWVLISFHGGRAAYMLFYFITAVPLVSLVYAAGVAWQFKYYQKVETGNVVKGESVDYYFSIQNEGRFYYDSIQAEISQEYAKVYQVEENPCFHLFPGEGKEMKASLCCRYRGEYQVGIGRFLVSDYLRLFSISHRVKAPLMVTVLPRVIPWEFEKEILEEEGVLQGINARSGELDVQVRNYEAGDGMRQIHWKASAKQGKLFSREQEERFRQGILLLLDLQKHEESEKEELVFEDCMMEQAVSAVHACLMRKIPVTFICENGKTSVFRIRNEAEWKEFYATCGKMRFEAEHSLYRIPLETALLRELKYAVCFTGAADTELLHWMKQEFAGVRSSVIFVSGETLSTERAVWTEAGIGFYQTYGEQERI